MYTKRFSGIKVLAVFENHHANEVQAFSF